MVNYYNPVETVFGSSSLNQIGKLTERYRNNDNILIIADKFMRNIGIIQRIEKFLLYKEYNVKTFEKVMTNPNFKLIDEASLFATSDNFGLIIGIGGGSALDCAKCAAIISRNEGKISEYLNGIKTISNSGIPLIEVPTTAGTGSEVTMWATVWKDEGDIKKKYSLSNEKMYAKAALLDPELTISLPPHLTASTGLDALSQAIEAYWSRNHNPTSDKHALEAISLINENIENAYKNPTKIEFREKMLLGSLESGLAFSNTKTTAVHSVSYPITAHFDVPHGLACALTLAAFLEFNSIEGEDNLEEAPQRILDIAYQMNCKTVQEVKSRITEIMKNMNLPIRFRDVGINKKDIDIIVNEGFTKGRVENNPRKLYLKSFLIKI
ncbi:Long-chain-alcohol dehydrogenase 1 [subsurface metagenome]